MSHAAPARQPETKRAQRNHHTTLAVSGPKNGVRSHRQLKVRAAQQGRTLSDYVLDELKVAAGRPTMSRWLADVDSLPPPDGAPTPAVALCG